MKKFALLLLFSILCFYSLAKELKAQPSNPASTIRSGTALPSTCKTTGPNVFYRTDQAKLYICSATNTWSLPPGGAASGVTIGTSTITGGTTTRILYDNAGVFGEYTVSGTGTVVPLTASPTFSGTVTIPRLILTPVSLTDNGTTIATDASLGNNFLVTALTANVTLSNPTNSTNGQIATWEVIQNASAAKTLAFGTNFGFGAEITACTISTTLSSHNFVTAVYNSTATKWYVRGCLTGF